jgi:hypothetical protein
MEDIINHLLKDRERFLKHMPFKGDSDLVILKGHLLIEELLSELIEEKLKFPQAYKKIDFRFIQRLRLTEAFYKSDANVWLFSAIKMLNSIRNNLVHRIDDEDLNKKLVDFVKLVEKESKEPYPWVLVKEFGKLTLAIASLHARLSALLQKTKESILSLEL